LRVGKLVFGARNPLGRFMAFEYLNLFKLSEIKTNMSESTIAEAMKRVPGTIYHSHAVIRDRHGMVVGFRDFDVRRASPVERVAENYVAEVPKK